MPARRQKSRARSISAPGTAPEGQKTAPRRRGLAAGRWLLAAETLPTKQKSVLIRVSGEKEILMRQIRSHPRQRGEGNFDASAVGTALSPRSSTLRVPPSHLPTLSPYPHSHSRAWPWGRSPLQPSSDDEHRGEAILLQPHIREGSSGAVHPYPCEVPGLERGVSFNERARRNLRAIHMVDPPSIADLALRRKQRQPNHVLGIDGGKQFDLDAVAAKSRRQSSQTLRSIRSGTEKVRSASVLNDDGALVGDAIASAAPKRHAASVIGRFLRHQSTAEAALLYATGWL